MKTHYDLQGTPNCPLLMFSNSLGTTFSMWDDVMPYLLPYFRILRYDTRGHGNSDVTPDPYTIAILGQDVIDLLDELGIPEVHFCGLSMGGLIGQWLTIHHPERIKKLVVSNTAAKIGSAEAWKSRIDLIQQQGMKAIADKTLDVWFTKDFQENHSQKVAAFKKMFLANNVLGYGNCCLAISDVDFRNDLSTIGTETLVIAGDEDPATDVDDGRFLVDNIPNAVMRVLSARHLPPSEVSLEYAKALIDFLIGDSLFDRGMHVRRTVLGDTHVDKANAGINPFNADFQYFISRYAWGEIWTRPGLSKHNRSLITLAMLIALDKKNEFKMHVKAAINNSVTPEELKEVILQSALYCGLPAANEAIHNAEEVLRELKIDFEG